MDGFTTIKNVHVHKVIHWIMDEFTSLVNGD